MLMPVAAAVGVMLADGKYDLVLGGCYTLASNVGGLLTGLVLGLLFQRLRRAPAEDMAARKLIRFAVTGGLIAIVAIGTVGVMLGGRGEEKRPWLEELKQSEWVESVLIIPGQPPLVISNSSIEPPPDDRTKLREIGAIVIAAESLAGENSADGTAIVD